MRVVQILPEGPQFWMLRVLWQEATTEECVDVRKRVCRPRDARQGPCFSHVSFQASPPAATTQLFGAAVGIENDDVPRAEVS